MNKTEYKFIDILTDFETTIDIADVSEAFLEYDDTVLTIINIDGLVFRCDKEKNKELFEALSDKMSA